VNEGDRNGERDEGHHPGQPRRELARGTPQEYKSTVEEDERRDDEWDEIRSGERGRLESEERPQDPRVQDHRDRENEGYVEAVAEHCDRMPGVLVEGFPRVPLAVLCVRSVSLRVTPSA